ncbi:MAG: hypothetical protein FWD31_08935 [Planctomycetaceae bacterium]|nr:hypothetical protein [Planctomycetaceae bacterium]
MSISTKYSRNGIASAILFVFLSVSVFAQTTATPDATAPAPGTSQLAGSTVPVFPAVPPAGPVADTMLGAMPFGAMQPGMPGAGTGYGTMPGMGLPPATAGAYGVMPGQMGAGAMPMGMRPSSAFMGHDPEMNAMLARQLQDLRNQETLLNSEITMMGGETSPAARPLLSQRVMLQTQIRQLELQLGVSGTANLPGATSNPMGTMPPNTMMPGTIPAGAMPPGMTGYGAAMIPADRMVQAMASQGMPPAMPGFGMPGMIGAGPNAMMLEQLRQDAVTELQYVQRTLTFVDAADPARAIIEARQEELLAQLESLDRQLGQNSTQPATTPGIATPNVAGSAAPTFADRAAQPARANAAINPEIVRMQNTERQLRVMGRTDLADDLQRQIEQAQTQGFVEPQVPASMMPMPMPATLSPPVPAILPQQGELAELRSTVDSLRSEITMMRDEIRALNAMLRQWDQTSGANGTNEMMPAYPEIPPTE